ncbi:hypothetical protein SS50377_26643 [Spironucleus salmonicida]|uniref:Uncharacterized protein n=1 Tax=Spironucleus salmonicida TaxID=348837 RepID=V6LB66_9EUKA|nr:hypothetical protein SS50377_26643 [Spironucleus salmonicida]|eukprot:EST41488.1 Hypothetical protein SS50377_19215 [Spironucleus salmonicida]
MGRQPPANHQLFHQHFSYLVQDRAGVQQKNLDPQTALQLFESLTTFKKSNFWPQLNDLIGVTGDWTVKHFTNCYRKYAYTGIMAQHSDEADQIVFNYCTDLFGSNINQAKVKTIVRQELAKYHIFPTSIDNYVYGAIRKFKANLLKPTQTIIPNIYELQNEEFTYNFDQSEEKTILASLGLINAFPSLQSINFSSIQDIGEFW